MGLKYVWNIFSYSLKKTCHQRKLKQTKCLLFDFVKLPCAIRWLWDKKKYFTNIPGQTFRLMDLEYVWNIFSYSLKKTCHQRKLRQTKCLLFDFVKLPCAIQWLWDKRKYFTNIPGHGHLSIEKQIGLDINVDFKDDLRFDCLT